MSKIKDYEERKKNNVMSNNFKPRNEDCMVSNNIYWKPRKKEHGE
jgi:hypothetical protein